MQDELVTGVDPSPGPSVTARSAVLVDFDGTIVGILDIGPPAPLPGLDVEAMRELVGAYTYKHRAR